jgi:hypothetical protein
MIGLSRHAALILVKRVLEDMLGWEMHRDERRSRNPQGSQILLTALSRLQFEIVELKAEPEDPPAASRASKKPFGQMRNQNTRRNL